jgi:GNAT superfamily N-acetyltransferase
MEIREARPEDNDELIALQMACPQGKKLIVSIVNTPDFFAKAKAYESYKVLVVLDGKRIIGSGSFGIRRAIIDGEKVRIAYGFQGFVASEYRRRGALRLMQITAERYAIRENAHIYYVLVEENNTPAVRNYERNGFKLHRKLIVSTMPVYKELDEPFKSNIGNAEPEDLPAVAKILNETWHEHELYEPTTAETIEQFINRAPGYRLSNLLVYREGDKVMACLGFWNKHKLMSITVQALSLKIRLVGFLAGLAGFLRPMPKPIKPGTVLKQIVLTPIGFKKSAHFAALLRHVNNKALKMGIEQIFCICEKDNAIIKSMKGFIRVSSTYNLHIKALRGNDVSLDKPVYIDGIDL